MRQRILLYLSIALLIFSIQYFYFFSPGIRTLIFQFSSYLGFVGIILSGIATSFIFFYFFFKSLENRNLIFKYKKKLLIVFLIAALFIFLFFGFKISFTLYFFSCPKYFNAPLSIAPLTFFEELSIKYINKFCPLSIPVSFNTQLAFSQSINTDLNNLRNASPILVRAYDKIKIFDVWNFVNRKFLSFSTTTIGIIDTGIDTQHPEFQGIDFGNSAPNALQDRAIEMFPDRIELLSGHGTAVAGIIGANNLSKTQILASISPQMNGIIAGVTDKYILESRSLQLIKDAPSTIIKFGAIIDTLPPLSLINMSFRGDKCSFVVSGFCIKDSDFDEITNYFKEGIESHPFDTFIIAAGNDGINVQNSTPSNINLPNTIIAGATDLNDKRAIFLNGSSNFGFGVNISTPGVSVYSPAIRGKGNFPLFGDESFNYLKEFSGTSAAAPMVTGVAAILKALEPEYQKFTPELVMSPAKIKEILIKSADPINTGEFDKPLGKDCFNFNPSLHTGCRENSHRAAAWLFPPTPSALSTSTITSNSITLSWTKSPEFENPDFASYKLFRSTSLPVTQSSILITIITNSSTLTFTDTNLSSNTQFFYKLFIFDKAGLSAGSNEAFVKTLLAIPKPPKPYTLNPHTFFYTPLDNFYEFQGQKFIPELADTPTIPDSNHDCSIFTGAIYSIVPGQFNNALQAVGKGRAIRENANFVCNNRLVRLIGDPFPDHTVGFWLKSDTPPEILSYIFFMFNFVGPDLEGRPIWIGFVSDQSMFIITHPIIRPPINDLRSRSPKFFDGNWHHYLVVFNYTQQKIRLFIDGQFHKEISVITSIPTGQNNTEIMMGQSGFWVPNAVLDDFFVENRAWMQEDITRFLTTGDVPTNNPHVSVILDPNTLPDVPLSRFSSSTIFTTSTTR